MKIEMGEINMDREIAEKLNEEAQELVEIFNLQLNELSSEGNTKVVEALTTLGHIVGKEVQILKESNKLLFNAFKRTLNERT
jgi:uncharacterized protein YegL